MSLQRSCENCGREFRVWDEDLRFYERFTPSFHGKRFSLPPPSWCPECRLQRRLTFVNKLYVYTRRSSQTGKPLFSMYTDDAPFPVVEKNLWWGDSWNAMDFGFEPNYSESFFRQFERLRNSVPHYPLSVSDDENSDYCNQASFLKNCYLVFSAMRSQDCTACDDISSCRDCLDCTYCHDCELCYDCVNSSHCYSVQSSEGCENCSSSYYLLNCRSCTDCFRCANLRHAQYCIENRQVSKEEYEGFLAAQKLDSHHSRLLLAEQADSFYRKHPRPHCYKRQTENCTGNFIIASKNVHEGYYLAAGEDLRYVFDIWAGTKDCMDFTYWGIDTQLVYESVCCGNNSFNLKFCYDCWGGSSNLLYCWMCIGCQDCFGCVGLRKARHCIFNRQYTPEEYERTAARLIEGMQERGEWGAFFPLKLSPFAYNETAAQQHFPLTRGRAEDFGFKWLERESVPQPSAVKAIDLPDVLPPLDKSIEVLSERSGRMFRISAAEMRHYRKLKAPLPRLTYDERMAESRRKLCSAKLHRRRCAKTGRELETPYTPDAPWIIWDLEEYEKHFGS